MTIHAFQRSLEQKLTELGAESPRFDAAQLLRWLSGQEQAWLIAHTADPCPEDWQSRQRTPWPDSGTANRSSTCWGNGSSTA